MHSSNVGLVFCYFSAVVSLFTAEFVDVTLKQDRSHSVQRHSTLTEVFPCFPQSLLANARILNYATTASFQILSNS
jgi:hypothetical protein